MSQKSPTTLKSDSKAKASNQAESSKSLTKDEINEWIRRLKEPGRGSTTDAWAYLRHYETAEDEEQGAEEEDDDDDFDWVKFTKESRERRAAKEAQRLKEAQSPKEAQSSEQKKA